MVKGLSQAEINRISEQGARMLRGDRKDPVVLNLQNAIDLGQNLPLVWREKEYRVRPLSYRDAQQLRHAALVTDRWEKNPPQTVEESEDEQADQVQTLALMHSFLDPMPPVNPFLDFQELEEVGWLIGFFYACRTIQRELSKSAGSHSPTSTN